MKVLWVTSAFPDPKGTGGMVHEFELLRSVAARHEITLLTTFWMIRQEALAAVRELGVSVEAIPWPWQRAGVTGNKIVKLIRLMLGAGPTAGLAKHAPRLAPLARAIMRNERAAPVDLVFVVQGEIAPVLDAARAQTALLLYDVFARQTALVSSGLSPRAIRYRLERRNARRWEPRQYRKADAVACVSQVDAALVSSMLGIEIATIPNPVPDEFFDPPAVTRSGNMVAVIGSFGWEPNVDSVEWMCAEIWPRVLRARPDARLCVVGRFGSPELRRTVAAAGGEFHGDVEDIRSYYWEAAVVAANVRMGSGMRNKVLHAMACSAPLVATPSALEGIDAAAGEHLLLGEDAAGVADAIIETLNNPAAAADRAQKARGIAAQYSAASAGAALERWWMGTVQGRPAAVPAEDRPGTAPTATVVLCTRERTTLLRESLASIAGAVEQVPGTEIVVVEQGTPSAAAVCADLGLDATIIHDTGVGVSRARNIGARRARGEVVLFTDDDCLIPPDWVRAHVEALRSTDVAATFGAVIGLRYQEDFDPVGLPARHRDGSPPWLVGHSSNMAVRVSALRSIGGFDERIGPGTPRIPAGEDADLIVRLLRTGSTLLTGIGSPIRHADWRSGSERAANLVAYEHGAGVWIGKTLRRQPRTALTHMRARVDLQRHTAAAAEAAGDGSISRGSMMRAFMKGIAEGVRMRPWRGPLPEARPSDSALGPSGTVSGERTDTVDRRR